MLVVTLPGGHAETRDQAETIGATACGDGSVLTLGRKLQDGSVETRVPVRSTGGEASRGCCATSIIGSGSSEGKQTELVGNARGKTP